MGKIFSTGVDGTILESQSGVNTRHLVSSADLLTCMDSHDILVMQVHRIAGGGHDMWTTPAEGERGGVAFRASSRQLLLTTEVGYFHHVVEVD